MVWQRNLYELRKERHRFSTLWIGFDSKTGENTLHRVIGYRDWLSSQLLKFHQKSCFKLPRPSVVFCCFFFYLPLCVSLNFVSFVQLLCLFRALGEYFMIFFWSLSFSLRCLWWLHTHQSSWILYCGVFHKPGQLADLCLSLTVSFFLLLLWRFCWVTKEVY